VHSHARPWCTRAVEDEMFNDLPAAEEAISIDVPAAGDALPIDAPAAEAMEAAGVTSTLFALDGPVWQAREYLEQKEPVTAGKMFPLWI